MLKRKSKIKTSESKRAEKTIHGGTGLIEIKAKIHPIHETVGKMSALAYGRSGSGKTTFAASIVNLPDYKEDRDRVLLLDMREEGTDSVYDIENIDVINIEGWGDFEGAYWYLKDGRHPYKAAIVDTVTQLQFLAMTEAKKRAGKSPNAAMNKLSWGFLSSMLGPKLLDFRDLDIHTCFLAQDRREISEQGDDDAEDLLPEMGPAVMPSISKSLTAMVKVIGQTFIQQQPKKTKKGMQYVTEFRMRLGPHPFYLTKLRTPRKNIVPKSISNPTFTKIVKIMRGEYGSKSNV